MSEYRGLIETVRPDGLGGPTIRIRHRRTSGDVDSTWARGACFGRGEVIVFPFDGPGNECPVCWESTP